ncbi:MAG: ATP-dependent Clp protease adapter ClpS [Halobacteriovoraceae bacterium]|nr:ATP-dependent Clp protease adapter ClpS [Halobacteriovoraceae bacterium]
MAIVESILNPSLNNDTESDESGSVSVLDKVKVIPPRKYKVLLHNDDYTTMDFVIHILQKFFGKNIEQANEIMIKVHNEGVATCGIYTREIAESKSIKVNQYSKTNGHPLKCSIEPEDI